MPVDLAKCAWKAATRQCCVCARRAFLQEQSRVISLVDPGEKPQSQVCVCRSFLQEEGDLVSYIGVVRKKGCSSRGENKERSRGKVLHWHTQSPPKPPSHSRPLSLCHMHACAHALTHMNVHTYQRTVPGEHLLCDSAEERRTGKEKRLMIGCSALTFFRKKHSVEHGIMTLKIQDARCCTQGKKTGRRDASRWRAEG